MKFTKNDALTAVNAMNLKLENLQFGLKEIRRGMNVELEHGTVRDMTNVTNNDLVMTAKIALAHLFEDPLYYEKLSKFEGGGTQLQSVIFNKKYYDVEKAERFLRKHQLKPIKQLHETDKYLRYRQAEPDNSKHYYTVKLNNGVIFIMMTGLRDERSSSLGK